MHETTGIPARGAGGGVVKSSIAKIIWDTRTPRTIRARADFTIKAIIINHYVMTKMTMVVIFSD